MKYLVLGSSGQIGAPLCEWLRAQGDDVLTFDLVNGPREDLRVYQNPYLEECMAACDFVFFLAFDVGGSRYLKIYQETYEFLSNNARLMEFGFESIQRHKKPFIFASSQMANMSYSSYGTLKAMGDHYVKSLGGLVVKFWNVYGVEHDLSKSHVITDFVLKARDTRLIDMMTDGEEYRQMLYADDCCKCLHILAKQYDSVPRDKPLHVTNFDWSKIIDIAHLIARHFPGTEIVPAKSGDDVQRDKRNEPDRFILNYWKPETALKDGIKQLVAYHVRGH
jgi:nucleoside-diphosphate-sugar epimerase